MQSTITAEQLKQVSNQRKCQIMREIIKGNLKFVR